ncbi:MAG: TOBE domain-containing protein [Acidimicrobiales bacterium]
MLVTHDPLDAFALADAVVVVDHGVVTQAGPVAELTARPRSRYVADLVGLNLVAGTAHQRTVAVAGTDATIALADPADGEVLVRIHPHAVAVHTSEPAGSPRNRWPARIAGIDLFGDRVRLRLDGAVPLVAEVTTEALTALGLHEGADVWASVKATEITTYPR